MQAIPCSLIRGGSSRGAYFLAANLPADVKVRDSVLLRVMGGPDALQVNGIGGGHPLTSKVAVVNASQDPEVDVDFLFLQVDPTRQTVSSAQNCGNILAGVGVFALAQGLVDAAPERTQVRVRMLNSGAICHLMLATPGGEYEPEGETAIDGVPGTGSAVFCRYLEIAGATCGSLLPTGNTIDVFNGREATCVDNGMPVVLLRAADLGLSGQEAPEALDADSALKQTLESIRLQAGPAMNLGDVADKSVPKLSLISAPRHGGLVGTRTFIPHVCHKSIGVLGAVSVATGCLLPGSVAEGLALAPPGNTKLVDVEHPDGALRVQIELDGEGNVVNAGIVRTARLLFAGEVMV